MVVLKVLYSKSRMIAISFLLNNCELMFLLLFFYKYETDISIDIIKANPRSFKLAFGDLYIINS